MIAYHCDCLHTNNTCTYVCPVSEWEVDGELVHVILFFLLQATDATSIIQTQCGLQVSEIPTERCDDGPPVRSTSSSTSSTTTLTGACYQKERAFTTSQFAAANTDSLTIKNMHAELSSSWYSWHLFRVAYSFDWIAFTNYHKIIYKCYCGVLYWITSCGDV